MRVLIYEPVFGGHRLNFVRLLALALQQLEVQTIIATSAVALTSAEWGVHLAAILQGEKIDASLINPGRGVIRNAWQRARDLSGVVDRHRPDWMLIPYADGLAQMIGLASICGRQLLPKSLPVEGLQLRGGFAYRQDRLRARLQAEASWRLAVAYPWHRLHQLDPVVHEQLLLRRPKLSGRIDLMPDPIPTPPSIDRASARKELGLDSSGLWCGCVGGIDTRKGIDLLIRAFADMKHPDARLLLAGRADSAVRDLLTGPYATLVQKNRIVALDRYISDRELDLAVAAMDLVCTPYPRHIGSASIVIRAAAAGRPVLGSDFGWVGWTINKHGLGTTCDVTQPDEFTFALTTALNTSAGYLQSERALAFANFHSPANFQGVWTREIRKALSQLTSPQPLPMTPVA